DTIPFVGAGSALSGKTKTRHSAGHVFHVFNSDFSFGPFKTPTTPGTYVIPIQAINKVNLGQRAGITNGSITITVPGPDSGVCTDTDANNTGEPLPCTFDSICTDNNANNKGDPKPCKYDNNTTVTSPTSTGAVECTEGDATCPPTPKPVVCVAPQVKINNKCVDMPKPADIEQMTLQAIPSLVSKGNQCTLVANLNSNYQPTCTMTGAGFADPNFSVSATGTVKVKEDGSVLGAFTGSHDSAIPSPGIQNAQIYSLSCTSNDGMDPPDLHRPDIVTVVATTSCKVVPSEVEQ
ncbi:MAG: hypothetical protein PHV42_04315, partial [Candidatus Pacebacteria bacterium]|nr:hypothetical protein [Candidatus Paceibacterota bacterium]